MRSHARPWFHEAVDAEVWLAWVAGGKICRHGYVTGARVDCARTCSFCEAESWHFLYGPATESRRAIVEAVPAYLRASRH